jgi:hypothetical protein
VIAGASAALAVAALLMAPAASAADQQFYVDQAGSDTTDCTTDAPCLTIGRALALAGSSAATVHVGAGWFAESLATNGAPLTIVGSGAGATVLAAPDGDGADLGGGSLTLQDLMLLGSSAGPAAGVLQQGGTLTTSHVTIDGFPCGLVVAGGTATLTDSTVSNTGRYGSVCPGSYPNAGVAVLPGANVSLLRSQVRDSAAVPGVLVQGTVTALDSTFSDRADLFNPNRAGFGPAIEVTGGSASIARSLFRLDHIAVRASGGTAIVSDSTLSANDSGMVAAGGNATALRDTFVDSPNSATKGATAVLVAGSVLSGSPACGGRIVDGGYNLSSDASCGLDAGAANRTLNLASSADDHGGNTQGVAVASPSPAADHIPVGATYGADQAPLCPPDATDQRGVARPQGTACDAGAFELVPTATTLTATPELVRPGDNVHLVATIAPVAGSFGDPDPVEGSVVFAENGSSLCIPTRQQDGSWACDLDQLDAGSHTITAQFDSTSSYLGSTSSPVTVVVTIAPVFTSADHATATIGTPTAIAVHADGAPAPAISRGGTLPAGMRFVHGAGTAYLTGKPVAGSANSYLLSLRATNVGGTATTPFTLTVVKATPRVAFTTSPVKPRAGKPTMLTVTVTGTAGRPTGTVRVTTGAKTLSGCGAVSLRRGTGSCTTRFSKGRRTVSARYSGSTSYGAASTTRTFTVG